MAEIRTNGTSLHYEVQGSGRSVVLVHGSWVDGSSWSRVAPQLAEHCTVVSYDRRGHGHSAAPAGQGSVYEDVADLAGLIEGLELAPAFVCGNSFGSLITLRLAAARPELVRGIAVHEPPGVGLLVDDPMVRPIALAVREGLNPVRAVLETGDYVAAAELFVDTVAFGPGAWGQLPAPVRDVFVRNAPTFLDELRDPDAPGLDLGALGAYHGPALLTGSDNSPPMFGPVLDRIAAVLPQAERHLYAGAGHAPQLTDPEEYLRVTLPRALRRQP
ncbi:pimeloyl-ACP methyl ester carboxylesterase [Streptacidiphilus sp. MAP12-16]|uniref:alpha/beta fold hydrolase n=1 Tax=Streptacidiphilus sp. MAP12-16 TaxID=3156300 RepID=UPI00351945C9